MEPDRPATSELHGGDSGPEMALVMKGGGVKGLAYAGALQELEPHYRFSTYVGSSAGAIAAVLLGAGYRPKELEEVLRQKPLGELLDTPRYLRLLGLLRGYVHSGEKLQAWLTERLRARHQQAQSEAYPRESGITLGQLQHHVVVYVAAHPRGTLKFDSRLDAEVDAAFAARASAAIPVFFRRAEHNGQRLYDGGVLHNFPAKDFAAAYPRIRWIGLYIDGERRRRTWSVLEVLELLIERDDLRTLDDHVDDIVRINTRPVDTVDFELTAQAKEYLVQSGRLAALKFLRADAKRRKSQASVDAYNQSIAALETRVNGLRDELLREKRRRRLVFARWLGAIVVLVVMIAVVRHYDDAARMRTLSIYEEPASERERALPNTACPPKTTRFEVLFEVWNLSPFQRYREFLVEARRGFILRSSGARADWMVENTEEQRRIAAEHSRVSILQVGIRGRVPAFDRRTAQFDVCVFNGDVAEWSRREVLAAKTPE